MFAIAILLLCDGIQGGNAVPPNNARIMDDFRELDAITISRDISRAVRFLDKLDKENYWSFGAGLGPTDRRSLQLSAVRAWKDFLFDSKGHLVAGDGNTNEPKKQIDTGAVSWTSTLSIGADSAKILNLLSHENPAVRWVGVYKASFLLKESPELKNAIRQLATADPYIVIARQEVASKDGLPAPPGLTTNVFVAPLREASENALSAASENAPASKDLSFDGVSMLLKLYVASPLYRADILNALYYLDPAEKARVEAALRAPEIVKNYAADEVRLFQRASEANIYTDPTKFEAPTTGKK